MPVLISSTAHRNAFSSGSLIPDLGQTTLRAVSIRHEVRFLPREEALEWTTVFKLNKVASGRSGNDVWYDVTSCPRGELIRAGSGDDTTYQTTTFIDERNNLVHVIDFGRQLAMNESLDLSIRKTTRGLDSEHKLISLRRGRIYKAWLLRYDVAYTRGVDELTFKYTLDRGRVVEAFPRSLVVDGSLSASGVVVKRTALRPREVFTPLIWVSSGSKVLETVIQAALTFLLGVASGVVASHLYQGYFTS